jgi:signal transduction histidine kinase/ligand-binding sensor domain-containing protein
MKPIIPVWHVVGTWLLLAAACANSFALETHRTIAQLAHTAWGPKEGAPGLVKALAQTRDGYLWLGTASGLYRFDGLIFEQYQPQSGEPIPARNVHSLLALPNGDLWIGFQSGGISLLRNGHATNYTSRDGVPNTTIESFARDREGTMWAATDLGLTRLKDNRWEELGRGWNFPGELAHAIYLDHQGTLWAATEDTLVFLPPGAKRFRPTGIRVGQVTQIRQAVSGKLWMAETTRSVRPVPLSNKPKSPDETEIQVGSLGILFDNEGALWITTAGDGLRRVPSPDLMRGKVKEFSNAIESFTARDGLSDNVALTALQDREGNIWVGTRSGLDRFRKTNLVPIVLPFDTLYAAVAAGDAGDVWAERLGSMVRVHGGRIQREPFPSPRSVLYVYRDSADVIWWVGVDSIHRYSAGSFSTLALPQSFPKPYLAENAIVATKDGSGTVWLSAKTEGLFYLKRGVWQRLQTALKFAQLSPRAAFTDEIGRAWFGYEDGTIVVLEHEDIQKVIFPDDSPVGSVRTISGRGRHIWVGGESGVAFFDGVRLRRIIPADTDTFGSVVGIEETSGGALWLGERRGVIEIAANEVQKALDDPSYRVRYRIFDTSDGLPGTFVGNGALPNEAQGTDGLLWFVASGGIASVDPGNIFTNPLPPPVWIRSVKSNGRQVDSPSNLVLPAGTNDLQISYTALSLSVPEKVRFRYRLEEVDKGWQDASNRRQAFYTMLGPGRYHFRVVACNNDGVWNDEGAHLDFKIAPTWYQTAWFRTLCGAALILLLWMLYQLRMRQLERQFILATGTRLDERVRIARELHDTLLQGFHGVMFQFQAARNLLPRKQEAAMQALDQAILATMKAITEGRNAIQDLRPEPATQRDLAELLTAAGQEAARVLTLNWHPPTFRVIVQGKLRGLSPVLQDEIYRIGRELIRNAFLHAVASRIEVDIQYEERQLRLRIRDDGKGIDPKVLKASGRPGHWGLPGIRERAQRISSPLKFWSEAGAGTEVELRVPAAIAYEKAPAGRRFGLFRTRGRDGQHS